MKWQWQCQEIWQREERDQTKERQKWKILRASRELDGDAQYNTLNRPDINTQRQSYWQEALTWHFWNSRNLAGPFYQLFWKGFKYPTFLPTSAGTLLRFVAVSLCVTQQSFTHPLSYNRINSIPLKPLSYPASSATLPFCLLATTKEIFSKD